jgi:hypothetical protein
MEGVKLTKKKNGLGLIIWIIYILIAMRGMPYPFSLKGYEKLEGGRKKYEKGNGRCSSNWTSRAKDKR